MEDTMTLTVEITDVNDNSPIFTESLYQITVPEHVPLNYLVATLVTANDADSATDRNNVRCFNVKHDPSWQKHYYS